MDNTNQKATGLNRRDLFKTGFVLAGGALLPAACAEPANSQTGISGNQPAKLSDKRKLGKLEVSSIGMGVQNMHRQYNTLVPYRPEMIEILRAAYDQGITFFDCAEAYGPHELTFR